MCMFTLNQQNGISALLFIAVEYDLKGPWLTFITKTDICETKMVSFHIQCLSDDVLTNNLF